MLKKLAIFLLLGGMFSIAQAQTDLTSFHSFIRLNTNDTAEAVENLYIFTSQDSEPFTFQRILPLLKKQRARFFTVKLDGMEQECTSHIKKKQLHIQCPPVNLPLGEHVYQLLYTIENAAALSDKQDVFQWQVFTNLWNRNIPFIRFELQLPPGAEGAENPQAFIHLKTGQTLPVQQEDFVFWGLSPLYPGSSFTVSAPLAKGIIQPTIWPTLDTPNTRGFVLLGVFLLLVLFYWTSWDRVGRDPRPRRVRCHKPPEGISAVEAQYICSMGRDFSIATVLLSLAIKGAIEIEREENQVIIRPLLHHKIMEQPIPSEEEIVYYGLFSTAGSRYVLSADTIPFAGKINAIHDILQDYLRFHCDDIFFTKNRVYNIPTILFLLLGSLFLAAGSISLSLSYIVSSFLLAFFSFFATHYHWKKTASLLAIYVAFALILKFPLQLFSLNIGTLSLAAAAILGGCFAQWIGAYTIKGRLLMDKLEGFREYLAIGESTRLARTNPTDQLKIFCKYLPYAYAFGMQNKWTRRFENFFSADDSLSVLRDNGLFLPEGNNISDALDSIFLFTPFNTKSN